jgi:glyoxylase-like metal-dependent hydrolase (beta-lactamase superfamily II)
MKDIPWISTGREALIVGSAAGALRGRVCTVRDLEPTGVGPWPDVKVSLEGRDEVLRPWQLVDAKLKTSHRASRLDEGLWFFEWQGYENNGNSVVLGGKGGVIVDAGHIHLLGSLLAALEAEDLSIDAFECALYTHSHPDHFDSAGLLFQAGLKVGMSTLEREYLLGNGGALYAFFGAQVPQIEFAVDLEPGSVKAAGLDLEVMHAPGHSPGSVCIYWKEKKAICVGDVVFPGGAFGRCDFPGGSYRILLDSFQVFDGLDLEFLLSGHGPAVVGRDSVQEAIGSSRNNLRAVIFSPW